MCHLRNQSIEASSTSLGGGTPKVAIANEENGRFFAPTFLPDGQHFLMAFRRTNTSGGEATENAIAICDLKTGSHRILLQTSSGTGFLVRNQGAAFDAGDELDIAGEKAGLLSTAEQAMPSVAVEL